MWYTEKLNIFSLLQTIFKDEKTFYDHFFLSRLSDTFISAPPGILLLEETGSLALYRYRVGLLKR